METVTCRSGGFFFAVGSGEARGVGDAAPYGCIIDGAVGRADVGSELSAASGRGSEVSEWPRSKFPASAVRQRRNFGHRNRIIGPYGGTRGAMGGRPQGSPLRKRYMGCVGAGLSCPPLCRPTDGHCRARQSGHFLETGLLHPPLAALRRFPRPRATTRVAPTEGYKRCGVEKNPPVTALP